MIFLSSDDTGNNCNCDLKPVISAEKLCMLGRGNGCERGRGADTAGALAE